MVRNHMRNVRFCSEKDKPVLKELCGQCTWAKEAQGMWKHLFSKGGKKKVRWRRGQITLSVRFFSVVSAGSDIPVRVLGAFCNLQNR